MPETQASHPQIPNQPHRRESHSQPRFLHRRPPRQKGVADPQTRQQEGALRICGGA